MAYRVFALPVTGLDNPDVSQEGGLWRMLSFRPSAKCASSDDSPARPRHGYGRQRRRLAPSIRGYYRFATTVAGSSFVNPSSRCSNFPSPYREIKGGRLASACEIFSAAEITCGMNWVTLLRSALVGTITKLKPAIT